MIILAVDPGPEQSAWLVYDTVTKRPKYFGILDNSDIIDLLAYEGKGFNLSTVLVIETMQTFGMKHIFQVVIDTAIWIGRFLQAWNRPSKQIKNTKVRLCICHNVRANSSNIRSALIDRFGGSKEAAIGTKKKKGPLWGIKTHLWSALALAVTYADMVAGKSNAD